LVKHADLKDLSESAQHAAGACRLLILLAIYQKSPNIAALGRKVICIIHHLIANRWMIDDWGCE
jgi:hypothetical protein